MTRQFMIRSLVGLAMLLATPSFASAQHGGHGGGHGGGGHGFGGHGGGHSFGGHRGGHSFGGHHGGHSFGGHRGGHSFGGHRGGHGFGGHGGGHSFGGRHAGGHGLGGHGFGGHGGFGHAAHHWSPHFAFYATPLYGGYGYPSYYASNAYSGSYVAGYRVVENVNAAPVLVEQVPAAANQQVAARPVTTPEGIAFQRKAETAFRSGN